MGPAELGAEVEVVAADGEASILPAEVVVALLADDGPAVPGQWSATSLTLSTRIVRDDEEFPEAAFPEEELPEFVDVVVLLSEVEFDDVSLAGVVIWPDTSISCPTLPLRASVLPVSV
jgi:hypothetical protein